MNRRSTSPSSTKSRFAHKFLRAMKRLDKKRPLSASDEYKRYLVIRTAAHVSMASAVGPRRAWSRAVLDKVRSKRRGLSRGNPRRCSLGFGDEEELRRLVPGGEGMGCCRLLTETAHYIKCLRDQVQVMTTVLRHYSS